MLVGNASFLIERCLQFRGAASSGVNVVLRGSLAAPCTLLSDGQPEPTQVDAESASTTRVPAGSRFHQRVPICAQPVRQLDVNAVLPFCRIPSVAEMQRLRSRLTRSTVRVLLADATKGFMHAEAADVSRVVREPLARRLVCVSNRISLPRRTAAPGGLAVGVLAALKRTGGMWFGWGGDLSDADPGEPDLQMRDGVTYALLELQRREFDGRDGLGRSHRPSDRLGQW